MKSQMYFHYHDSLLLRPLFALIMAYEKYRHDRNRSTRSNAEVRIMLTSSMTSKNEGCRSVQSQSPALPY